MSTPAHPPSRRIGFAERDAAVESLQEHHAAGRLSVEEFQERMQNALQARTEADLEPLFFDLPDDSASGMAWVSSAARAHNEVVTPGGDPGRLPQPQDEPQDESQDEPTEGGLHLPTDEPLWVNGLRLLSWAAFPIAIVCLIAFGAFWPMLVAIFLAPSGHAVADSMRKRHLENNKQRHSRQRRELP